MHVFTYGSLMFPEVWQRVTGDSRSGEPAQLTGYMRQGIRGVGYPGMVACPGAQVDGVLYRDVDAAAIAALDAFEGTEYLRRIVTVACAGGATVEAAAYLYLMPEKLSGLPWEPESFDLAAFIAVHCR